MKKVFLCLLTVLLIGLFALPARAGYHWSNGYYWNGGYAYSKYYQPGFYSYGSYVPGYYFYQYEPSAPAYTPTPTYATVPTYTSNWKTEVLQVAKLRDDHSSYLQAIAALGVNGRPFGTYGYTSGSYSSYLGTPATGQTQYGYSLSSVKEMYGATDLNVLYQQSARLTQGAQGLASDANKDFAGLVAQAGSNAGRVAEILARARGARTILDGVGAPPSSKTTTTVTGSGTAAATTPPADGGVIRKTTKDDNSACIKCHSTGTAKGGFKIADFTTGASQDLKQKVYDRLLTDDPKRQMPPPGEPQLSIQGLKAFLKR